MEEPAVRLKNILDQNRIPKGEIWIGSDFLKRGGFDDTLDNHFRIAELLGHDLVCLSVSENPHQSENLGYRYFEPRDLSPGLKDRTGLLAAVVDGPFQRMANKQGLMRLLTVWMEDRDSIRATYLGEQQIAFRLIEEVLEKGVDAIILVDDFAGDHAPFINPLELDEVCTPFYQQAVSAIRKEDGLVFLHCCGNLRQLLPLFSSWKLDGLAAIQISKNNIEQLDSKSGGILLTGIDAALLETDSPQTGEIEKLKEFISQFTDQRRLILCSDCGLYNADHWKRIQNIYMEL